MYKYLYLKPDVQDESSLEVYEHLIELLSNTSQENAFMLGLTLDHNYVYFKLGVLEEYLDTSKTAINSVYHNLEFLDPQDTDVEESYRYPIKYTNKTYFPIKSSSELNIEPINLLIEILQRQSNEYNHISFDIWIKPITKSIGDKLSVKNKYFSSKFKSLEAHKLISEKKLSKKYFADISVTLDHELSDDLGRELNLYLKMFNKTGSNSLKLLDKIIESHKIDVTDIYSIHELSGLIHIPNSFDSKKKLITKSQKILPIPEVVAKLAGRNDVTTFGIGLTEGAVDYASIADEDRNQHTYIIGKTGSGKTKLMELLVESDINRGKGLIYIDPHGDTAQNILKYVPKERVDDCVYADFTNESFVTVFNPIQMSGRNNEILIDNFIESFRRFFTAQWNPRLEFLLRQVLAALAYSDACTISEIPKLLSDPAYRKDLTNKIKDDSVKSFWTVEYPMFAESYAGQAVTPLMNIISQLLTNEKVRNIISLPKSTFDIKDIIENEKILVINLSSSELGEWGSSFLGSMIISRTLQLMLSQSDKSEIDRKQINLYVDEFQNFSTESFIKIFSEARKFKLALTIAHQYLNQIPEEIRKSILGNTGSLISFRLGQSDANIIAEEFKPEIDPHDLVQLDKRTFWAKLSVEGKVSKPFLGYTLDLVLPESDYSRKISQNSSSKYAKLTAEIEKEIEGTITFESSNDINTFPSPI